MTMKLERLRKDFHSVTGKSPAWFYCPILFRDEKAALCKAHIVNKAFEGSTGTWTVQRADVDNFFGSCFEAEFIDTQHIGEASLDRCLVDKELARRFKPEIHLKGDSVDYYFASENVPAEHTQVILETAVGTVKLALKISPSEVASSGSEDWQFTIQKDLRIAALVSLLKAAHLTLFEILGYRYGLSAGAHFMGSTILGSFFSQNQGRNKRQVIENATEHFAEFKNLVRPVASPSTAFEGTAIDGRLFVCETSAAVPWALMIFVRTSQTLHSVLVPIFDHVDGAARFLAFLKSESNHFEGRFCVFANKVFSAGPKTTLFDWPKADLL
jgi:hypothetical protein